MYVRNYYKKVYVNKTKRAKYKCKPCHFGLQEPLAQNMLCKRPLIVRVGENVGRACEKYTWKKFKWVHVYGITTIIISVANDVAQLSDA